MEYNEEFPQLRMSFPEMKNGATVGELYDPLIKYAIAGDETGRIYWRIW